MPLRHYGVLPARAVDRQREGAADSPHYQIKVRDARGTNYRVAVNVLSRLAPSELLYLADDDFRHPVVDLLPGADAGWTPLPPRSGGPHLDFIRGNLFDPADMRVLPPDAHGPDNDLADLLDHYVQRAIGDDGAVVYVVGERWGPEAGGKDKIFGFAPGNGVHDIHMNQGNSGAFRRDDGVWQDGGLLLHFPSEARWVGIFLAFQSQSWHTDDQTGHTLPAVLSAGAAAVRIVAALLRPAGTEPESVLLINTSPAPVDFTGWHLAGPPGSSHPVPAGPVAAGGTLRVPLPGGSRPGGRGGTLTLFDPHGLKVHGVAYTAVQAGREGWTTLF